MRIRVVIQSVIIQNIKMVLISHIQRTYLFVNKNKNDKKCSSHMYIQYTYNRQDVEFLDSVLQRHSR